MGASIFFTTEDTESTEGDDGGNHGWTRMNTDGFFGFTV